MGIPARWRQKQAEEERKEVFPQVDSSIQPTQRKKSPSLYNRLDFFPPSSFPRGGVVRFGGRGKRKPDGGDFFRGLGERDRKEEEEEEEESSNWAKLGERREGGRRRRQQPAGLKGVLKNPHRRLTSWIRQRWPRYIKKIPD